ncbi:hypothetical protein, partial [Salmonella sp. s58408]|uniref:hypothetical protein n=1 Tax=Salmonella sp. s58408 TaxID=3159701 RepID=UPI00397F6AA7
MRIALRAVRAVSGRAHSPKCVSQVLLLLLLLLAVVANYCLAVLSREESFLLLARQGTTTY